MSFSATTLGAAPSTAAADAADARQQPAAKPASSLLSITSPNAGRRLGDDSNTGKAARFLKRHAGRFQQMTVNDAIDAVSAKTERIAAETTTTLRGATEGAVGATAGLGLGVLKGSRGLLGRKHAFLARLATEEHTPTLVGYVEDFRKANGTPVVTIEMVRNLDGTAMAAPQTTEPTALDTYQYGRVNFDGDQFEAFLVEVKDDRNKVVAYLAIDDRDTDEMPVYVLPIA
jgi:hypothetical protein